MCLLQSHNHFNDLCYSLLNVVGYLFHSRFIRIICGGSKILAYVAKYVGSLKRFSRILELYNVIIIFDHLNTVKCYSYIVVYIKCLFVLLTLYTNNLWWLQDIRQRRQFPIVSLSNMLRILF